MSFSTGGQTPQRNVRAMGLAEYMTERSDRLAVVVVQSADKEGWDVALRMDGTYALLDDALEAASGVKGALLRNGVVMGFDVPRRPWRDDPDER